MPNNPAEELNAPYREEEMQRTAARLQTTFAHAAVSLSLADSDGRFIEVNSAFCVLTGYAEAELLAMGFAAITYPDDLPTKSALIKQLWAGEIPRFEIENRYVRKDGTLIWVRNNMSLVRDTAGQATGTIALSVDITEQVERQRRERFLAALAERARQMTDPQEVIADAIRSVGEFLSVSRCLFADIDIEADTCTVQLDYCADDTVASMAGTFSFAAFGAFVVAEYAVGNPVVVDDVRTDPVRVPPENLAAYEAPGIRAHITVPVVHSARTVSCISCHSAAPRHWEPEEVALLQTVVERTWLTVEVLRRGRALVHEAAELRAAHERTTRILESIADAFMALDSDWRFTYVNDQSERVMARKREDLLGRVFWDEFPAAVGSLFDREYRRAVDEQVSVIFEAFYAPLDIWVEVRAYPSAGGLSVFYQDVTARKALETRQEYLADANRLLLESTGEGIYGIDAQGCFTFVNRAAAQMLGYTPAEMIGRNGHLLIHHSHPDGSPYPEQECPIYHSLRIKAGVRIEDDVFWRRDGTSFPVSFNASPIMEGGTVMRTVVTFNDIGGRKALEAERMQIAEREHRIAEQLQAALQPELPETVPGLEVMKYYEAALTDQAGVGGDFYDVFSIEKGRTALVLGDLSGKGLLAAAAVATVRNMLRAFLYTKSAVAEAVTELNRVLAENDLLEGFTTLFVSVYDHATRELNFVNCGQEPALLRRAATDMVAQLSPTGPILGTLENVQYTEEAVTLAPGDALAIFSDGITECGQHRTDMLGIEGVAALFQPPFAAGEVQNAAEMAERLMLRLIAGVDAAGAGGVMRDDVCLLVAVVT